MSASFKKKKTVSSIARVCGRVVGRRQLLAPRARPWGYATEIAWALAWAGGSRARAPPATALVSRPAGLQTHIGTTHAFLRVSKSGQSDRPKNFGSAQTEQPKISCVYKLSIDP